MSKIKYEIISVMKESNKGNVYLAKVEGYGFPVIVKCLQRGNLKVYEVLQAMNNRHVPLIYRIEEDADGLLVVEEYIEGELLSTYLTGQDLTGEQYLSIAEQLCEGLKSLHQCVPPVIHRDIKPSNIVINSEGVVKIIDFDSSRQYKEESDSDTRLLGTEKYAAPEQYGFSQTDCRSDIYSLGVVFGMFPRFASEKRNRRWKKLVEKCTLFAPESRFQTVEEVEREITRITRVGRLDRKRIAAGSVVLVLFCVVLLYMAWGTRGKREGSRLTLPPVATKESEVTFTSTLVATKEPEATFTSTPEPEDEQDVMETQDESYRTTAPEWRDIAGEPEVYVLLKQELRDGRGVVMNCFKDRLGNRDFLLQVKELERPGTEYHGVMIYSYLSGQWVSLEETDSELRDSIVHIDGDYMKTLTEGYYKISVRIGREDASFEEKGITLYVAEHDELEEPGWWLQNTTFTYYGDNGEKINGVVKNDSGIEIAGLLYRQQRVDEFLYRIHCDGRAIEFSEELLRSKSSRDLAMFQVLGTDGSIVDVQISNYTE